MMHTLPELGYAYDALEPFIDARTMEIHYTKHHQAYIDKLNAALHTSVGEEWHNKPVEELLQNINDVPESIRTAVRNHGGGHFNHSFFWQILKKEVAPKGEIVNAINAKFGSLEKFQTDFKEAATTLFGSGWVWLAADKKGNLEIIKTSNQDSPISQNKIPILGLDVWEHAYYLKYQNKRPDYVDAFWYVVNWEKVNENYLESK